MPSFQYKTYLAKPHRKAAISVTPQMLALFMSAKVAVLTLPEKKHLCKPRVGSFSYYYYCGDCGRGAS